MTDGKWSNPVQPAFLVRIRSHLLKAALQGQTDSHFSVSSDQRKSQEPSCSTLATQFLTYIMTKLNQQSNFLLFLLQVFYKKTLRNKTQLEKNTLY